MVRKYLSAAAAVFVLLAVLGGCGQKQEEQKPQAVREVYDHVFDAGTYTSLDYGYAEEYFKKENDNNGGGCTAVAKVTDGGDTLIGRNMDLNISNKAAYIMHTAVEGCYKTVGLTYTFRDISPDYDDVVKNGLSESFSKLLPFMADDVLNEKGLYVEVNMRNGETWPNGEPKFSCSGTNPQAKQRVYMFTLSRYIGEHCATVDEALEYVKNLDVYSQYGYWNYCFLIADATGHYGVLEFAANQVIWNDMQQAQANFYVDTQLRDIQEFRAGVGRYDRVMEGIGDVQSEDDMYRLIDSVSYWQFYDPDNCQFDYRSENVASLPFATYEFVMREENRSFITQYMQEFGRYVRSLSRQQLRDANEYWESSFTEVINCNKKTLFVRFFENDEQTMTLSPIS